MKILSFGGGLGNQIFEYAFYLYLKEKYPQEKVFGLYNKKRLSEHYGLEIDRWFDVCLPPQTCYSTFIIGALYVYKKIVGKTKYVDTSSDECQNEKAIAFTSFKYTNKYIPSYNWINFKIIEAQQSKENILVLEKIRETQSVFIHVRRGDYLSPKYKKRFEGTCPLEYYRNAIHYINTNIQKTTFFVFSDDMSWAKKNLPLKSSYFVDWNCGENSPLDMYLMSQCKFAIIANSTFSFWGAYLGVDKHIVIYPHKWYNNQPSPNIFPTNWIEM